MAKKIIYEPSRTLMEFRLLPGLSSNETSMDQISLTTPLVNSKNSNLFLNVPIVSAAMQSVSGSEMGIELSKLGGTAFICCSQTIESQAREVSRIKNHKAGFVEPRTIHKDILIKDVYELGMSLNFSTFPVIDDEQMFLGLITKRDYDVKRHGLQKVSARMISKDKLEVGVDISDLKKANTLLMESHQSVLPILNNKGKVLNIIFRKDIEDHLHNPLAVVDEAKRLVSVAAINTYDYAERISELVKANVDALAIDSSDGFSAFQEKTISYIKKEYPNIPVIGGNIITAEAFDALASWGADAVKVGMGGGSICITQEQKGTGRGLATSVIKVAEARDKYFKKTGNYIPVIADGGIVNAKDIVIALAMGADYVMMGRYFARLDESPTEKLTINNRVMKPYWGEGSARARDWKEVRYHQAKFVEGVEGFVEYSGKLRDNLPETISKIKASMSSAGVKDIQELHEKAELELVSALSIREGKVHDIYMPGADGQYSSKSWGN
ncbi:MAG: IMP dehydrogenase [Pseudomonadota bacterium]